MSAIFVYVTTNSYERAQNIAQTIVSERLAGCANVLQGMTSFYNWKGKVETGAEIIIIFKTRADLFSALEARVVEIHHYDIPCIVALPLVDGHQPFLDWIVEQTSPEISAG